MKTSVFFSFGKFLAAITVLFITGCSPTFYIPNTQNIPTIKAKGQTSLTLAGNNNQFEFQGAYGLTRNLGIQVNGGIMVPKDLDNGNGGSGRFIEAGPGYFQPIGKKFLLEGYGLVGYGSLENHMPSTLAAFPQTTGKISANLLRVGIQPSFSFLSKYFSVSGSLRLASLNYSNIAGNLIFENADQVLLLTNDKSGFVIEPAITLRAGLEKIKFQLQFSKSWNLSHADFRQDDKLISVGLNFNFK